MLIVNATFRLVAGVSDDQFKAIDARFQEDFAYQQKGMMRRTTAKGEDGTWLVMTMWDSVESSDGPKNVTENAKAALEHAKRVYQLERVRKEVSDITWHLTAMDDGD